MDIIHKGFQAETEDPNQLNIRSTIVVPQD